MSVVPFTSRTLADLVSERLGTRAAAVENESGTTSVGTSAVVLLPLNPNRVAAIVINLSANTLYGAPKSVPSATNGIPVASNGGVMTLLWEEDFELTGYEWRFVATGVSSAVYVLSYRVY